MKKIIKRLPGIIWLFLCLYLLDYLRDMYSLSFGMYLIIGLSIAFIGNFLIDKLLSNEK